MSQLDFAPSDARAGFRLDRVELFNWGTFDARIWTLRPEGRNALVTGEIGSGKSTLVDAVTTLLVPAQRITYNKAAGAETRERNLRSYVLGYYKSERAQEGTSAKPVALRDVDTYAVILGSFYNEGFDQRVTLAQVFYFKDPQGQPARFYVVARKDLAIEEDFADFGADIAKLKKRLRKAGARVFDTFPPYGAELRRQMGIDNEQALDLFNQTVSMKSVGNLTDFVRDHMLEPFAVAERVDALIAHFDDLTRAHAAVQSAREQLAMLEPIVADGDAYDTLAEDIAADRRCRDALAPWMASRAVRLIDARIAQHDERLTVLGRTIEDAERTIGEIVERRDAIKQAIRDNGGDRIDGLKAEIQREEANAARARRDALRYDEARRTLDLPAPADEASFEANRRRARAEATKTADREAELQNELTEASVQLRDYKAQRDELEGELRSLRSRRSNIPSRTLSIRERLAEEVGLPHDALPFVGELIQVRDDERAWEGAIERVLHGFGLSLLVDDDDYRAVSAWVDRTHLGGRLVYLRVRPHRAGAKAASDPRSLVRKIVVRPDSAHGEWLLHELTRRFDYTCCEDLDGFARAERALTREGQVKHGRERHEKDDRHRIDDRSRYILGWTNEAKIEVLEARAATFERKCQEAGARIAQVSRSMDSLKSRANALQRLEAFERWTDIDEGRAAKRIEELSRDLAALQSASDVLRALRDQLAGVEVELATADTAVKESRREHAQLEERNLGLARHRLECSRKLERATDMDREQFARLDALHAEALGAAASTVESCQTEEENLREWLKQRIDAATKRLTTLAQRIVLGMSKFSQRWPLETREFDASVEAMGEYRAMLERIQSDDLPRFEDRFKRLLNENTIREIANFQAQLHKERLTIKERIATINRSLQKIDYNPGRHIALVAEQSAEVEVREFQQELRACTEGALTGSGDDQYTEAKFLQVKRIVERFKGREGTAELDRRWTAKVTDVRRWFVFSASERWHEDESEYEHYSDSSGKSGGQKEKLAYTVLAASLAYQFGLQWGEKRSRSFRFVVIDEAFGRGSDESTRYGLELFDRLNLQLLIVTPLQKIHIIEPYVSAVGFVHAKDGTRSMLRNLTIEAYREEKRSHQEVAV